MAISTNDGRGLQLDQPQQPVAGQPGSAHRRCCLEWRRQSGTRSWRLGVVRLVEVVLESGKGLDLPLQHHPES